MDNVNEDFWLQLSTDGGANFTTVEEWNLNDEFVNNTRYNDEVVITGPFTTNSQLRFRADASGNQDWVYIDDVVINGCIPTSSAIREAISVENSTTEVHYNTEMSQENISNKSIGLSVSPNPLIDV